MDAIGDILAGVVQKSLQNREPEDYVDDEGFLCCGKCHDRKQMDVNIPALAAGGTKTIRVGCLCKCGRERAAQEKREQERRDHRPGLFTVHLRPGRQAEPEGQRRLSPLR